MNLTVVNSSPVWKEALNLKFRIENGKLYHDGKEFSVNDNEIIRSVKSDGYTSNFSLQWNKFSQIQLDKFHNAEAQSLERFKRITNWNFDELEDLEILEAGCGAGRFSRILLEYSKANLFSFDYSSSVLANYSNNAGIRKFHLFQSDIYDLPFEEGQFDKIFCFGVIQFTPNPRKSLIALSKMLKPGAELIVDFFPFKGFYTKIHMKYLLRPVTRKMDNNRLLNLVESNIDWLIKAYDFFESIGLGRLVNRFLPICDLKNTLPEGLPNEKRREWAILDTFNMFSPAYDKPQKMKDIKRFIMDAGLEITFSGYLEYAKNHSVALVRARRKTKL